MSESRMNGCDAEVVQEHNGQHGGVQIRQRLTSSNVGNNRNGVLQEQQPLGSSAVSDSRNGALLEQPRRSSVDSAISLSERDSSRVENANQVDRSSNRHAIVGWSEDSGHFSGLFPSHGDAVAAPAIPSSQSSSSEDISIPMRAPVSARDSPENSVQGSPELARVRRSAEVQDTSS